MEMEKKKTIPYPYLPPELLIQIFLRLSVKSLIRFKSVCKTWFTLISDYNFANSHFKFPATHTRKILSLSSTKPPQIQSIDFEEKLVNNIYSASLSFNSSNFPLQIKGSCRGFLFLCNSLRFYLWNPSTGFHKQIPLSNSRYSKYLHGFGYDQSRDDYVVVLIGYDTKVVYHTSCLEFFSLRDNTWKEIKGTRLSYVSSLPGANRDIGGMIFNGGIHWLAFHCDSVADVIVAFDLMKKKLLEMRIPYNIAVIPRYCGLWIFGEFLSLWTTRRGHTIEIWMMKEYNVHSSWTNTHIFPINNTIPYFSPISTKNGDIIGIDDGIGLVKYNDKGHLLAQCSYCDDTSGSQVVIYTESLLSLPGCDIEQV
ncbi:F-box/kelch-repeat protein [Trifolium repens]|nr:F-box/kelch-repeat protein [Trifolium repens]